MSKNAPIKATTQQHLDVEEIVDNLVILKNGSATMILQTTSLNFGLLSESEQDATIFAYAGLLNSLSFTIQVVVRSKRTDITSYLALIAEAEAKQVNKDLKAQIRKYRDFIISTVQQQKVLDKKFYIVIPYSALEMGAKAALGALPKRGKSLPVAKSQILQAAKASLLPKKEHITKQLNRIGIKARELSTQELIELFYDIYNPSQIGSQKVATDSAAYTTVLVEPALDIPTTPMPVQNPVPATARPVSPVAPTGISVPTQAADVARQSLEEKLGINQDVQPTTAAAASQTPVQPENPNITPGPVPAQPAATAPLAGTQSGQTPAATQVLDPGSPTQRAAENVSGAQQKALDDLKLAMSKAGNLDK